MLGGRFDRCKKRKVNGVTNFLNGSSILENHQQEKKSPKPATYIDSASVESRNDFIAQLLAMLMERIYKYKFMHTTHLSSEKS